MKNKYEEYYTFHPPSINYYYFFFKNIAIKLLNIVKPTNHS